MTQKFKIRFEGLHGHLVSDWAALSELRAYRLPGWLPLWEKDETGADTLNILAPELTEEYCRVIRAGGSPR